MVANLTDDDIWQLNRGGHDPQKIYAAYAAAVAHSGQPTVILAKTVKGYGMGEAGEGMNITPPAEEAGGEVARGVPRSLSHPDPRRAHRRSALLQAVRRRARDALHARAPRGARRLRPCTSRRDGARRSRSPISRSSRSCSRARAIASTPPRWRTCALLTALLRDPELGPPRRADRAGRGAHLRHGGPVPPARHLRRRRPALRARRSRPGDVLPRGQEGPDPPGRHLRGGRDVVVDRRRHQLRQQRRADDPVLRVLLDVRLPARRRPVLGRRRHAHARLPDGGHGRSHDALGRRSPAPGRPQPALGLVDPELRRLRPGLRLRARGDRARGARPHAARARKTSSTTSR